MADVSKATQMNNGLAIQVYNEQSCLLMEKRMRAAYQSAIDELQKELDDFYEKYAANNKIDLQVAKQKLSLSDSENVKDLAEQYKQLLSKKNIGVRTQKKLDEIAAKTKVSRLEQLLVNCTKQAAEVGMKAKDEMIDVGSLMYKDGFGHTMFNIQKTVGMGVNFNMPSARVIKTASNVEWLGATFTDRTGYTLDRLTNNIEQIIPQLFIQGKNADEFGKAIAKQFNMSENAAKRDMRTLTTLITNQASILAYNNCEMVDEFEFVATLDGKTSDKCRAMDGKRFKLNEAAPFVNQPPLHYNCRSTTIPYFEDLDEYNPSERVARDEQGKTYMVPANMSYREWCTKHAQGLYANSDKTDWNYEPEKVLAYERIVDERRKLKALQEDRVVYQDSDFVINHDISSYSEEEIEHLMQLFNISIKEANKKDALQQKINETMTKINNIRKELKSDKTANILPAKDYNDIIGNLHKYYEMLNDEYDILNEKSSYQKYVKVMGLNDKPETMSRKDFESYTKKNKDLPVFYRAVTDAGPTGTAGGITRGKYLRRGILNDLMYGSQQYIGDGIYGDGLYFSTQPTHQNYGGFSGSANEAIDRKYMIKATFKSGTKKILYDDLEKMIDEYKEKGYNITDPSSFARSLGYHVIQAHKDSESEIYYNIIDRSCLVVQDVDKSNEVEIKKKRERKIIDIKQTKQKISDNVKQQMPTYDKTTVNNIKKAVNDGKSNDDAIRFIVDRMLLDDDVFSDLNILSNFENYIKEAVDDDDVYENAFNRTYDELYRKMDKMLDTDVPHKFVLYKRKDGTKVQTDLIFSDLEDWLFEMENVKNSDVVAKSFVLEKIRYQIYNEYVNDFSRRFIDELKESEYDDVDKLVKSYNSKFIKRSQELIEQAVPKKVSISKGGKAGPHILNDEEIKALERKDTYDFNELRRKAVKEFKYYKGTMKKAEIQNESLKQSEKISKNNEKYFHQTMLDIFEKNDFCMRLNKNVLPLIAQSKFMNQFETGSVPLGLTFNQRRVVAKKMFTIPQDAEGSEYEKYGFLGSKNPKDDFKDDESFTGDYGDSIVRFKKRNLMHRTTFTIGDSLFNCMHDDVRSSPVINPQIASIQRGHVNEVIYGLNVVENANAEKSYLDIQALTRQKYIELQYHGNLTIDDVESVTFNKKTTNINSSEVRKIIAMLKERGIKCYLSNSKSEVIEEL